MSQQTLFLDLIRISVLHILRATGFHAARPAALDALVDITARYLLALSLKTAENSHLTHDEDIPTVTDVRLALQEMGALRPQVEDMEEQYELDDDIRGVEAFIEWFKSDTNKEINRVAGISGALSQVDIEAGVERDDFLTALKKKHSKTGEESKFQGTMLGKDLDLHAVPIDGGLTESIKTWESSRRLSRSPRPLSAHSNSSNMISSISSPLSEIDMDEK